jgi:hypothetical protein
MEFREYGDIVFSSGAGSGLETAKMTLRSDGVLKVTTRIDAPEFRACYSAASGDCPPDFVFEKDFKLMDLGSLKKYLEKNKHLPEIPSAKEMLANGVDMKKMDMALLKKVEELTLYILELEKRLAKVETRK